MKARVQRRESPEKASGLTSPQLALLFNAEGHGEAYRAAERRGEILDFIGLPAISEWFRLHEMVDAEMAARWPRAEEPRAAFLLAVPPTIVRFSELLIRAHVREILGRFPADSPEPFELLTNAEILGMLAEASARYPLTHEDAQLYHWIAHETLPELVDAPLWYGDGGEIERVALTWRARTSPERDPRSVWRRIKAEGCDPGASRRVTCLPG